MQLSRKTLPAEGLDLPGSKRYYPTLTVGMFQIDVALINHGSYGHHHSAYVTLPAIFRGRFNAKELEVHGGVTWERVKDEAWTIGFDYRHAGDPNDRKDPAWADYFVARDEAINLARQITKILFPELLF